MKEDTIQHLASEMDELQEQHRDVLAKVRFSMNSRVFLLFSFWFVKMLFFIEAQSSDQFDIFVPNYTYVQLEPY